ncbi:C4-dicarboxylate transporter DcuC [Planctomyces sp. SH-PL62]|uniref:C4-dicarboxylate transporter DcuC n=1 Tax=Planctomyces sp. SH-PL62 TaxID=1636152 RepID=UPI00078E36A2|nr:C4-dicarboxylate transporter DcuC [Planctomyces sp. SH-PL62]AMV37206.1 Putative cryptic C4-dicarboxylate transporter DcuD [Planctomyces sp. SH-PL62]
MTILAWLAVVDLLAVVLLTARRVDVRLVLLLGALPLFAAAGGPGMVEMMRKVAAEMSNAATIVPIGSAMGFAYVLRMTGCDGEMVRLLLRPLRRAPALLVPGGIAAGYLVNTTIVSQAGTAAVLGPILIPLLRAGGLDAATAGAVLLMGASMGGELFNPGAVEMRKLSELTGIAGHEVVSRQAPLNFAACGSALLTFWILAARRARSESEADVEAEDGLGQMRVNPFKAMIPIAPLAILFMDGAMGPSSPLVEFAGPSKILTAMLVGVLLAWAAVPKTGSRLAPEFFEGAGYAYTHVISLIVAASTFAEGVRRSGLIQVLVRLLGDQPALAPMASVVIPWSLGVISGSGIAPAVAIMEFFVPAAEHLGLDPVRIGTLASLGAHFGRTMSPAAAVVAMCVRLSGESATNLIRRVVPPLLVGMAVMIVVSVLRLF